MSIKRQTVNMTDVYLFEAGILDAVNAIHECLFCESAPAGMTVAELVAKIRAAWGSGEKQCWEE